jgi:putative ABC transport system substrate-binding protein
VTRRVAALGVLLALGIFAAPAPAAAQQAGKVYRIGFIAMAPPATTEPLLAAFRQGLREHGWVEGQNVTIEQRWAEGAIAQLPGLAQELVRSNVDLILAWGTPPTAAARQATKTIPIVMVGVGDPLGSGFVASLARPGGNVTGVTNIARDLSAKVLELLKEVVPRAKRVAVLRSATNPVSEVFLKETRAAADTLGIRLQVVGVGQPDELDGAFAAMGRERAEAVTVLADPMFISQRERIAKLAVGHRLPSAFPRRESVEAGGLLSYGPNLRDQVRRAAAYVDRIFKGAKPAALPVEQPTTMELVINLKAAKALGLTIPQSVLLRADHVIE